MATEITAVGVDKDKHSQVAVKWAIDNLLSSDSRVILIHVRMRNSSSSNPGSEGDVKQLFLPYRGFCARKGVRTKEVVLDDTDIPGAILAYINQNFISNIVVGASARGFIQSWSKKIPDVPTALNKSVPEFCSLYVISKGGKAITIKTALRPPPANPSLAKTSPQNSYTTAPQNSFTTAPQNSYTSQPQISYTSQPKSMSQFSYDAASLEDTKQSGKNESMEGRSWEKSKDYNRYLPRDRTPANQKSPTQSSHSGESMFTPRTAHSQESSVPSDSGSFSYLSGDMLNNHSNASSTHSHSHSTPSMIEAEMRRLKQELKQTMEMYSTACKEAVSAKQLTEDYQKWQKEEATKFEEAKQAEEAALSLANLENTKAKAAREAAETSKKLAQLEAKRRNELERKARSEAAEGKSKGMNGFSGGDIRYRKYYIEDIKVATGNFTDAQKIGEGGYGPVFRGYLDHTPVAIKVLRSDAAQGMKQFHQEVEVLSCIRHPNMVLLLGACPEYGCLVYEYMDNGSLEDRLLMKGGSPPIPWQTRFRIAAEIATALLFLHQTKPEPLVHRDLKPGNILLDGNYRSKISDVGLARLVPPSVANSVTQYHMTSAAGTFCYIDPEYQQTGMLGTKSDIYSLGIMLLQIITAKPPMGLAHNVSRAIKKGTFADMLDPTVEDWPVEEALAFAKMALKCAELRKKDRPDLGSEILPELSRLRALGFSGNNFGGFRPAPNSSNSNSTLSQGSIPSDPTGRSQQGNSNSAVTGRGGHYMPSRLRDDDDDGDDDEEEVENKHEETSDDENED